MISSDFIKDYGLTISILLLASYFGTQIKEKMNLDNTDNEEHDLIKKYILNDSPLYGYKKPKLWIHSKYEINSRNWNSFQSRNNTDLNQQYLEFTIKSIVNKCSKDFHVCLIDDKSFNKLIPGFDKKIYNMPEPLKSQYREIALLELIYLYGGLIVPNSLLCMKNLKDLYDSLEKENKPFVFEKNNKYCNVKSGRKVEYVPDINMMGCVKNCPTIYSLMRILKLDLDKGHISSANDFIGKTSHILMNMINSNDIISVDGSLIGIKDENGKPIIIEDLFSSNKSIHFSNDLYAINLPSKEILERNKYNWLPALKEDDLLKSNINLVDYIKVSQVSEHFDNKKSKIPTYF
jgi:hypothetical protein